MITTLISHRLILRPIDHVDCSMLQHLFSDPDDCLLLGCDPFEKDGVSNRILQHIVSNKTGAGYHWAIVRKDLNLPIGFCDTFLPASHQVCLQFGEIAFGLDKLHRKMGYMGEALATCLKFLFQTGRFKRVEASVNPTNLRSSRLLETLGFQREGVQRQKWVWGGQRHDILAYALLPEELSNNLKR